MQLHSGNPQQLPAGLYSELSRFRHMVFVERLGWTLDTDPGAEQDQFDRPDTVYVVAKDENERITGCARLLPTTRPYLLGEVFPELLNGMAPPCAEDIWELSRFAAIDFSAKHTSAVSQFSSEIAVQLLHASIQCAAAHGAKEMITVSPIGVERLLRRAGFQARRAGPPMIIDGHPIFACLIKVDADAESVVKERKTA